ncbi:MAG: T9SS type A sorting domain-containing protein [Candidatus Eisenbacteria bacterium]|nr:T9SS type A sorting domain-containing protein [Candidatus Eisenbacteria bacterium]
MDSSGVVAFALDPGDFVLLRLAAPANPAWVQPPASSAGPGLRVAPNPATGLVRFDVAGVTGVARLEVLDLAGRAVWSRALPPGTRAATWSGERAGAGRAGSGIYFVRLRDARGAVVRRIAWLGGR